MLYCSACNIIYPPGDRYCTRCKEHLSYLPALQEKDTQIKCPNCERITAIDKGHCVFCNAALPADLGINALKASTDEIVDDTPPTPPTVGDNVMSVFFKTVK